MRGRMKLAFSTVVPVPHPSSARGGRQGRGIGEDESPKGTFARLTVGMTLVLTQPKREPDLALGSRHKPPALAVVSGSVPPIPRKHFQLPSGSFLSTTSTLPRICFASPPGESTYEAVN